MIVRPVFPPAGTPIDTSTPDARAQLAALYPAPPLRLNLVTSVDGRFRDDAGTSAGLTAGADRAILGAIRSVSDAVLVGATTFRAEPDLVPRSRPMVVLTRGGDFGGASVPGDRGPVLVAGPADAEARVRRTLDGPFDYLAVPDDLRDIVALLLGRFPRVVCEGGPSLARALLAEDLVDELCLTTSPLLLGGESSAIGAPAIEASATGLTLRRLLVDDAGVTFARWTLRG